MASRKRNRMDKVCGMCGDIGDGKKLVTCNHCMKNAEHTYCMKGQLYGVSTLWYCQECLQCLSVVQGAEKTFKKQRIFHAASETRRDTSKRSIAFSCKASPSCLCDDKSRPGAQKPIVSEVGSHKMLDTLGEGKVSVLGSPSGYNVMEPLSCKAQESIATQKLATTKGVAFLESGLKPSILSPQLSVRTSINISTSVNSHANQDISQTDKRHVHADTRRSSKCIITKQLVSNNVKDKWMSKTKNSAEHPQEQTIDPDEKLSRNHASQACWKGTFEILELGGSNVFRGIQAYFPCVVNPKIDEIAKDLPEKLKFRVSTRKSVWPRIFQLDPPTKEDIGLYFFSCDLGRSKEKYTRLLKRLASRDRALQVCVKDIKFLMFSSYQLPVDSQRIDGEAYLWGVFLHSHKKLSMRTKADCPSNSATATHCELMNVPLQLNPVHIIRHKENAKTDTMTSPGFPAPNLRDFRDIGNSSDKFPLKKVGYPVESDIPPGFSKIRPPGVTELRGGTELNLPSDSGSKNIDVRRDREIGKPSLLVPSIDTSPGFPEPSSTEFNYDSSSLVEFPPIKMANPNDPDVPPGFCLLQPPGTKVEVDPRVATLIYLDIPPGFSKLSPPGTKAEVEPRMATPIHLDIPPGFSKLSPPATKFEVKPRVASSIDLDIPPGFSKLLPPGTEVGVKPKCHQDSDISCKYAKLPGSSSLTHSKQEKKDFNSPGPPEVEVNLHLTSKNFSSHTEKIVSGSSKSHSSWMRRIYATGSPEPVSASHDKPLTKSGTYCSPASRSNACDQPSVISKRNPVEVRKVDMPGDTKIVDILPGSSEIDRKAHMPGDTKINEISKSIPKLDALTSPLETISGEGRSFVKFSFKKVASSISSSVPLCFSEHGPPCKSKLTNAEGKISLCEDSYTSPCPSKVDNTDLISSPTGGSYAKTVPKICKVQPKCHKATTGCGRKFIEHPRSAGPNLSVEKNTSFGSVASPDECQKVHSVIKSPSSLYGKEKVHGLYVNSSDVRLHATSEERLKNLHERSRDVGASNENNPESNSLSISIESLSALKRRLLVMKTAYGQVSTKEEKPVETREVPSRTSGLQEHQAKNSHGTVSDEAKGVGEVQGKHKEDSVKEKHRGTRQVQEGKTEVSSKHVSLERTSEQAKGEGKTRRKSLVSVFYGSPLISHEPGSKQTKMV